VSGTWTAWADGHSRTVRQCPRRTAPVPARVAGVAMVAGQRACSPCLGRPVACGSSSSGPASGPLCRTSCHVRSGCRKAHSVSTRGGRCAVGGRTSVRASDRRRHRHGHRHQPWLCLPDTSRPERGGFRKQRTVNPLIVPLVATSSTLLKAGLRAAAYGGRSRPGSDGYWDTGLTSEQACLSVVCWLRRQVEVERTTRGKPVKQPLQRCWWGAGDHDRQQRHSTLQGVSQARTARNATGQEVLSAGSAPWTPACRRRG